MYPVEGYTEKVEDLDREERHRYAEVHWYDYSSGRNYLHCIFPVACGVYCKSPVVHR
jgi:hypothetical protein